MRPARPAAWAVVATMIGSSVVCAALTSVVRPDGSGDFANIQAAIDAAAPGDTVQLADGVFPGVGNRDLQFGGKPLTLRSAGGDAAACILDAEGGEAAPHRAVWLHDLPLPGALLEGMTFRNGYDAGAGGGVYVNGCRVVVRNCVFRDNQGAFWFGGAGMAVLGGEAELEDCLFAGNRAHSTGIPMAAGGGLAPTGGVLTATGCVFRDNLAVAGIMGPSRGGLPSRRRFRLRAGEQPVGPGGDGGGVRRGLRSLRVLPARRGR